MAFRNTLVNEGVKALGAEVRIKGLSLFNFARFMVYDDDVNTSMVSVFVLFNFYFDSIHLYERLAAVSVPGRFRLDQYATLPKARRSQQLLNVGLMPSEDAFQMHIANGKARYGAISRSSGPWVKKKSKFANELLPLFKSGVQKVIFRKLILIK